MRKTAKSRETNKRTAGSGMGMRDDREAEGPRGTVGKEMAPEGKKKELSVKGPEGRGMKRSEDLKMGVGKEPKA